MSAETARLRGAMEDVARVFERLRDSAAAASANANDRGDRAAADFNDGRRSAYHAAAWHMRRALAAPTRERLCPAIRGELTCVLDEGHNGKHRTHAGDDWLSAEPHSCACGAPATMWSGFSGNCDACRVAANEKADRRAGFVDDF